MSRSRGSRRVSNWRTSSREIIWVLMRDSRRSGTAASMVSPEIASRVREIISGTPRAKPFIRANVA